MRDLKTLSDQELLDLMVPEGDDYHEKLYAELFDNPLLLISGTPESEEYLASELHKDRLLQAHQETLRRAKAGDEDAIMDLALNAEYDRRILVNGRVG